MGMNGELDRAMSEKRFAEVNLCFLATDSYQDIYVLTFIKKDIKDKLVLLSIKIIPIL